MLESILHISTILLIVVIVSFIYASIRIYREARAHAQKVRWGREQLNNALSQIYSDDENKIVAGLQTMSMLNDPDIRTKAMPRLIELSHSKIPYLEIQAKAAIQRLSSQVSDGIKTSTEKASK